MLVPAGSRAARRISGSAPPTRTSSTSTPGTGAVLAHLHVGRTLAQGAEAPDETIWFPDKEQSLVYRIDPVRRRVVDSFPAGPGAYLALRAFGSMWVLSYAGADVRRFA